MNISPFNPSKVETKQQEQLRSSHQSPTVRFNARTCRHRLLAECHFRRDLRRYRHSHSWPQLFLERKYANITKKLRDIMKKNGVRLQHRKFEQNPQKPQFIICSPFKMHLFKVNPLCSDNIILQQEGCFLGGKCYHWHLTQFLLEIDGFVVRAWPTPEQNLQRNVM